MTFVTDKPFCISPPLPTHTYTYFKMLNSMPYFSVVVRSHWRLQQVTLLMYYYCHYSSNSFFRSYEIWIMNRIWISTYFLCYVNGLAEVHQNRLVVCGWLFSSNLWVLHTYRLERERSAQICSFDATSARTKALFENYFLIKTFSR